MGFDATGGKPYQGNQASPMWYGLVALVVIVCFGGVYLGPKLLGYQKDPSELSVAQLVKGQDLPKAAGIVHSYGFPDELTQSLLKLMQQVDEVGHSQLVTNMARSAQNGADRTQMAVHFGGWALSFWDRYGDLIARSDISYAEQSLLLLSEGFQALRATGETACDLGELTRASQSAEAFAADYMGYNNPLYRLSIQGYLLMIDAALNGKDTAKTQIEWTEEDELSVADLKAAILVDEDLKSVLTVAGVLPYPVPASVDEGGEGKEADLVDMQAGVLPEEPAETEQAPVYDGIDVCSVGDAYSMQFYTLPEVTRAKLWALKFAPLFTTVEKTT